MAANRMTAIPFAGIRKVFEKATRLEKKGKKVIHFEIGRPDFNTPEHIKAVAVAALKGDQACVDQMVEEFDARWRVMIRGIEKSPGLTCPVVPTSAFYVFARHEVPGMNSSDLADHLLEKGGVAVVPGPSFGSKGEGYLRISYATALEDCREGMERIAHAMGQLDP